MNRAPLFIAAAMLVSGEIGWNLGGPEKTIEGTIGEKSAPLVSSKLMRNTISSRAVETLQKSEEPEVSHEMQTLMEIPGETILRDKVGITEEEIKKMAPDKILFLASKYLLSQAKNRHEILTIISRENSEKEQEYQESQTKLIADIRGHIRKDQDAQIQSFCDTSETLLWWLTKQICKKDTTVAYLRDIAERDMLLRWTLEIGFSKSTEHFLPSYTWQADEGQTWQKLASYAKMSLSGLQKK